MKKLSVFFVVGIAFLLTAATIDLDNLFNYENQSIPVYITKDNTDGNPITDEGATLGRVLFYDKNLSSNNAISCASCHKQEFAFGDTAVVSVGVNGVTGRHSMRLINARFADEVHFFWDERAVDLETQVTMPIQDHAEMGFSGTNGDGDIFDLIAKLDTIDYYNDLFFAAFGDTIITEEKMQFALAQFVRSIQSFDAKYDVGRAQAPNDGAPFANYTTVENQGKDLFLAPPVFNANGQRIGGGLGCAGCHRPPEFDIDPASLNNGIIGVAGDPGSPDLTNTRSPSLRDLANTNGVMNGPLMHTGGFATIQAVIAHYDLMVNSDNPNLDTRLKPGGNVQKLNMTQNEKNALEAFLLTLSGTDVYTNEKWSDPFEANGDITVIGGSLALEDQFVSIDVHVYPNPADDVLNVVIPNMNGRLEIYDINGKQMHYEPSFYNKASMNISNFSKGAYFVVVYDQYDQLVGNTEFIKR